MCLSYPTACHRFLNYRITDQEAKIESNSYEFFKKDTTETASKADKKEKRSRSRKKSSKKKCSYYQHPASLTNQQL